MRCLPRWLISNLWQYHVPQKLFAAPHYIGRRLQLLKHLRSWLKSYVPHWAASKKSFATLPKCLHWASSPLRSTSTTGKIRSTSSSLAITTFIYEFRLLSPNFDFLSRNFDFLSHNFNFFIISIYHVFNVQFSSSFLFCFTARNVLPYQSLHVLSEKKKEPRTHRCAYTCGAVIATQFCHIT